MNISEMQKLLLLQVLCDSLSISGDPFSLTRQQRIHLYSLIINQQGDETYVITPGEPGDPLMCNCGKKSKSIVSQKGAVEFFCTECLEKTTNKEPIDE